MKALRIIGIIVIIALLSIATYIGYYGFFLSINVQEHTIEYETLVYKNMTGDYSKSKVLMDEVYQALLADCGVDTKVGFGIYYDNPQEVATDKLRSEIGCVVAAEDTSKLSMLKEGYMTKQLVNKKALVTQFPLKGASSILVGMLKVYPVLTDKLKEINKEYNAAMMEVYDVPNRKIVYRALLDD